MLWDYFDFFLLLANRSFLARAQTEGYLGTSLSLAPPLPQPAGAAKIIRPIASKATIPNYGFLSNSHALSDNAHSYVASCMQQEENSKNNMEKVIETKESVDTSNIQHNEDEEDEEVFIDSSSDYSDLECNTERSIVKRINNSCLQANERNKDKSFFASSENEDADDVVVITTLHKKERLHKNNKQTNKSKRSSKSKRNFSGLQVAKAPIPASQLDLAEAATAVSTSKFIVDVASCDGPVRFRRILNTAYGHKPEANSCANLQQPAERTQQSLSLSFHQQMTKAINQQRQLNHQHGDESENSESSGGGAGTSSKSMNGSKSHGSNNEIFVCVYCKHTFKSQYCYQKHAKRHLNPLNLNSADKQPLCRPATSFTNAPTAVTINKCANDLLKREVRPLDMNVQYYPCKTCGSKFPSYYFVHKHRKMCHAEEEAAAAAAAVATVGAISSDNVRHQQQDSDASQSGDDVPLNSRQEEKNNDIKSNE